MSETKKRKSEDSDNVDFDPAEARRLTAKYVKLMDTEIIKELLVDLSEERSAFDKIFEIANQHQVFRKIFVRGLSLDTTTETLTQIFGAFGEMEDCAVSFERGSGKSRGFGFVIYKELSSAEEALKNPSQFVDGRKIMWSLAALKQETPAASMSGAPAIAGAIPIGGITDSLESRKLFIRHLADETTTESLTAVFAPYGDIVDCAVIFDKETGKSKHFGFVVYSTAAGAAKALAQPQKELDGKNCIAMLAANPNNSMHQQYQQLQAPLSHSMYSTSSMHSSAPYSSAPYGSAQGYGSTQGGYMGYSSQQPSSYQQQLQALQQAQQVLQQQALQASSARPPYGPPGQPGKYRR